MPVKQLSSGLEAGRLIVASAAGAFRFISRARRLRARARDRVARSTSPRAGFRSLQVGAAHSAGTAVVALFSYFLNTAESWRCRREKPRNAKSSSPNVHFSLHWPPDPEDMGRPGPRCSNGVSLCRSSSGVRTTCRRHPTPVPFRASRTRTRAPVATDPCIAGVIGPVAAARVPTPKATTPVTPTRRTP